MVPGHPVIYIDDSDIVKPEGHKFEALGWVRDGSESTAAKNVYQKGYHVTEATVLTSSHHPVSLFSEIHSSAEKNFTSINDITFSAMERASALFEKATFVMDRGYDDNKMFLKLDSMDQDYVIRLTAKRKLLYHNKWVFATELRSRRKGKVKLPLHYKGKITGCLSFPCKSTDHRFEERYQSCTRLWNHRTSHDACHQQKAPIERRCDKDCKALFFQMAY